MSGFIRSFVSFIASVGIISIAGQEPGPAAVNAPAKPAKWKWEQMDNGPIFSSGLQGAHPVLKSITIKLGTNEAAAMAFDTELLRMAAGWTGGFLKLPRGRDGLEGFPEPDGTFTFATPVAPGYSKDGDFTDPRAEKQGHIPKEQAHWKGLYLRENNVILHYSAGGNDILELPGFVSTNGLQIFTRLIQLRMHREAGVMILCEDTNAIARLEGPLAILDKPEPDPSDEAIITAVGLAPRGIGAVLETTGGQVRLRFRDRSRAGIFQVSIWKGRRGDLPQFRRFAATSPQVRDLREYCSGGPLRWPEKIVTRGTLGNGAGPYVVDTLTLPEQNPWNSWLRCSGIDFFSDGTRAAVCSVSGDVWIVSGIDDTLQNLTWKRFAAGLFQPLGLKIIADHVHVLGRDQITRFYDQNRDGEADLYENFNNDVFITKEYHEFCLDLQTDSQRNFYFAKGDSLGRGKHPHHGSILKIPKDGSKIDVVATGLRAPNGMGIGPNDEITVSDNEGNWVPASRLNLIKPGGFYGYVPSSHRSPNPTDYDRPLCWLPKNIDNSSGGQVWVTSDQWGPFRGHMLHMSYGACSLFKVFYEEIDGQAQGGVVRFPLRFDSGIMRGRFNPKDGQLYTCGLVVWQSNGARQGAVHRVRYTGQPVHMPTALRVRKGGIEIVFTSPLDPASVTDLQNWAAEQWNYEWTEKYGSPEFSVRHPGQKGRDSIDLKSAALLADNRTVFLEIPDLKPVMQMKVKFALRAADGSPIDHELYHTIHRVPEK